MANPPRLEIDVRPERLAISRLAATEGLPAWALEGDGLVAIVRRDDELSIVRDEAGVPADVRADRGWRALEVRGPLDLGLTGILASVDAPLADARVTIFAVSTYDTDLVLVRKGDLTRARAALVAAGHHVSGPAVAGPAA